MSKYYIIGYEPPSGIESRQAVKDWQARLGVETDGVWGPNTAKAYDQWKQTNEIEDSGMQDTSNNGVLASTHSTMPNNYGATHSGKNDLDYSGLLARSIETSTLSSNEKTKAKSVLGGLETEQLLQLYSDVKRDGVEKYFSQDAFDRRTYALLFPEKAREARLSELADEFTALGPGRSPVYEDALRRKAAMGEEIGKQVTGEEFLEPAKQNTEDAAQLPWSDDVIERILNTHKGLEMKDLSKVVESRCNKSIYVSNTYQYLIHQGKIYKLQSRKTGAQVQISAPPINSSKVEITRKEFDWAKAILAMDFEDPKTKPIYAGYRSLSDGNAPALASIFTLIGGLTDAAINGFKYTTVTVRFNEFQGGRTEAHMYLYGDQPLWNNDPNNYGFIRASDINATNVGKMRNNYEEIAEFVEQYTGVACDWWDLYDIYYYYDPQRKKSQLPTDLVFTGDGRLAEVFSLLPNERCVIVNSKREIVADLSQALTVPRELSQELTDWILTAFQANL